jgi:hypothetical protein
VEGDSNPSQLGATKYEKFGRGFKPLLPIGAMKAEGFYACFYAFCLHPSAFLNQFEVIETFRRNVSTKLCGLQKSDVESPRLSSVG